MIIGSHVSFSGKQLLSSALEAISYNANAFMFYTGAPQNTVRSKINAEYTAQALEVMKEHNIDIKNVICHAPYIINLANNKDESKYEFSKNFLKGEITRCHELGVKYIVLHPGSSVGIDRLTALDNIANALKQVLEGDEDITILLETMASKGTELGINIDELKYIIKSVNNDKLGVCLDTCHLNDSGVDINNFEIYLNIFDREIGLDKIHCIHINDSKNPLGARKGILLTDDEAEYAFKYIKNNYDDVLNNPASFKIEDHEKKFSEENYQKLKELVKEYIKYLK